MSPDSYLVALRQALDDYRFAEVGRLTEQILPTEFTPAQVKYALQLLRRKRLFADLEKTTSLFALAGHTTPTVRRHWAQALLDQNRVRQALCALEALAQEVVHDTEEGSEVRGLIGRAYKQLFVNEGPNEYLLKAIAAYRLGWLQRVGDYRWHGINLVALLACAERDAIDPQVRERIPEVASAILAETKRLDPETAGVWDYGTAMEASIALGNKTEVLRWMRKYVRHPRADAFEIGSTLRQLKEVWNLGGTPLGKAIIPVLEYELLQHEGGTIEPTAVKVSTPEGFEAVYGTESYIRVEWMDTMYARCSAVARVFDTATGDCWGTGFLLKGSFFSERWGPAPVFVTNSHVISSNRADESPLRPGQGSIEFTRLPTRPRVPLGELLFPCPRVELDVSIFRLQVPPEYPALEPLFEPLPALEGKGTPERIYVIGPRKGANWRCHCMITAWLGTKTSRCIIGARPTTEVRAHRCLRANGNLSRSITAHERHYR